MTPELPRDGRWRIYRARQHWWQFPYTVDGPGEIGVAITLWGAKLRLRRLKAKAGRTNDEAPYWHHPVVYEEPS